MPGILSTSSLIIPATVISGCYHSSLRMKELRLRGEMPWHDHLVCMWQIWGLKFGWCAPQPLFFTVYFSSWWKHYCFLRHWMLVHIIVEYYCWMHNDDTVADGSPAGAFSHYPWICDHRQCLENFGILIQTVGSLPQKLKWLAVARLMSLWLFPRIL